MAIIRVADRPMWYVVQTKPRQEARVEANLHGLGLETLFPKLRERTIPASSRGSLDRVGPLFPRYLFARFVAASVLAKVRNTRGVHGVVGFGEYATPVEERVISLVRSRIRDDGFVHPAEPQPGDVVQIVDGPLRSLIGIFERELSPRDRVLVLLTTVGSQLRVQLRKAGIRSAPATSVRLTGS